MKRREFLKSSAVLSAPMLLNGLNVRAEMSNPFLKALGSVENGRKLVIIQMNGGNDGLNTVFPKDQYSNLLNARDNILMNESAILNLPGFPATGLHPSMHAMQNLFTNGFLNITQSVSYPNPNFSHFRATDIWFTGSASDEQLTTGWVGRHLNEEFPGYPDQYPTAAMPHPLAIQIGSQASLMTQGPSLNMCMTVSNPDYFYNLVNGISDPAPPTPYGDELTYMRNIKRQSNTYNGAIRDAFNATATLSDRYPSGNLLADQLKIVARLIKGGLKTPVYVVNHPNSFDTHSNQVDLADRKQGLQANLLGALSNAMDGFQDDLLLMGIDDFVLGMTFTEFGRRIRSNASFGTDHGAAVPMFFFGRKVNPVVLGTNPVIGNNIDPQESIPMQFDFRSVYFTILKNWFELNPAQINSILPGNFDELAILASGTSLPVTFISFEGKWLNDDTATLTWKVDQEEQIISYEILRSDNGSDYKTIGTVGAQPGGVVNTYHFDDRSASRHLYYYRIRVKELSGSPKYSSVLLLRRKQKATPLRMKVMPNPVTDRFTLAFEERINGIVAARLVDINGREVWKRVSEAVDQNNIDFRFSRTVIKPGVYTVEVIFNNERAAAKLVVQ
ncbi:MAG: DUF1501 domain-containing protein [Chitinophagaceae bacterium]|nr:DUF1501 domain-containing protein [Chitinophagaceae bacterium]